MPVVNVYEPKKEPIKPELDRTFYFDDSQVVLQVEDRTYKVHRYFLTRESQTFRDLFDLCSSEDPASVEGSDINPIKVPETHINEFENILRFLYFGMHHDYAPSLADWIAILSISTRLDFAKVRERVIKEITTRMDQVDPFELIGLAVKYKVEQWLKPAYRRIVTREKLIAYQETVKVSLPVANMLMRSREQYWKDHGSSAQKTKISTVKDISWPRGCPDTIIDSQIRIMEMDMASVEASPPKTEPKTGLSQ